MGLGKYGMPDLISVEHRRCFNYLDHFPLAETIRPRIRMIALIDESSLEFVAGEPN